MAQNKRPRIGSITKPGGPSKLASLQSWNKRSKRDKGTPTGEQGNHARTAELSDHTCHLGYDSADDYTFHHETKSPPTAATNSSLQEQQEQQSHDIFSGHEVVVISDEARDADEREYIIRLLSRRAMHLPHMNWWQDWLQYMKNNHLILGIFFHHELHPLRAPHRLYILLASVAFGLAATNCIYLYYAFHDEEMDQILVEIALDESPLNFQKLEALEITYGMVALWTFGGALHSIFDIGMWYLSACACFLSGASCSNRGKYQVIGSYIVIALTAVLVALALFVVLMRAAYDRRLRLAEQGIMLKEFQWEELGRIKNFSFLIGYVIELILVYFAYYPIFITILFTGILPCIGRPKELEKQYRERKAREKRYRIFDQNGNECV